RGRDTVAARRRRAIRVSHRSVERQMEQPVSLTAESSSLGRIHLLLAVQSLVVVLVSINRLGSWTLGYVASNEFLRWVDLHNMLTLPLVSIVAFYLLKKVVEVEPLPADAARDRVARGQLLVN